MDDRIAEVLQDLYSAYAEAVGGESVGIDFAIGCIEDKYPELFEEADGE